MTDREVMQQALDALGPDDSCYREERVDRVMSLLRAAIAQPASQTVEPFRHWCETCEGMGYFDATLGSDSRLANPKQKCPDCDGNGYWMPSAAPVAQLVQPDEDVKKWGLGLLAKAKDNAMDRAALAAFN